MKFGHHLPDRSDCGGKGWFNYPCVFYNNLQETLHKHYIKCHFLGQCHITAAISALGHVLGSSLMILTVVIPTNFHWALDL